MLITGASFIGACLVVRLADSGVHLPPVVCTAEKLRKVQAQVDTGAVARR